ncbi:hypothetical protein NPIL_595711 [Nephila pilipes]|uniref:Uncharacterized protein n=1 Tax=Nephila pilipes TaxID=299642 RepID=A0A8X6Q617_NEPPI|nr:hypothetical protein NPIL_595711 [Nephila pilipes]
MSPLDPIKQNLQTCHQGLSLGKIRHQVCVGAQLQTQRPENEKAKDLNSKSFSAFADSTHPEACPTNYKSSHSIWKPESPNRLRRFKKTKSQAWAAICCDNVSTGYPFSKSNFPVPGVGRLGKISSRPPSFGFNPSFSFRRSLLT